MQMTLLDMTQDILSSLSSDEVNSISDTVESMQVARIVKNKYYDLITRINLPEHDQLIQLDPSLDSDAPVLMFVPDGVAEIKWLKYFDTNVTDDANSPQHDINTDIEDSVNADTPPPGYKYVTILPIRQFIDMVNGFNPSDSNVDSFTFTDPTSSFTGDYTFYFKTDRTPSFCTIMSNYSIVFDSYDITQDSTLQGSKSMAWGRVIPAFTMADTFIPDLDDEQFTLLLNEAKAMAYFELKQSVHPKAEQEIKRGWSSVQKNKAVTNRPTYFDALPDFGRSGRGFHSNSSYFKARGFDK